MWLGEVLAQLLGVSVDQAMQTLEGEGYNAASQFLSGFTQTVNGEQRYLVLYAFVDPNEQLVI